MERIPDYTKLAEQVRTLFTIVNDLKRKDEKFDEKLIELEKKLGDININVVEIKGYFREEINGLENRIRELLQTSQSNEHKLIREERDELKGERIWFKRLLIASLLLPLLLDAIKIYIAR